MTRIHRAGWIDSNRPDEFPDADALPVHVARRDEIRSRPRVVLNASESKPIPAMPHTARVKLDVHLFSQGGCARWRSFYEWGPGTGGRKQANEFRDPEDDYLWIAGLWEPGEKDPGFCYTMVKSS